MVAQPDPSPAVTPSATTMATNRDGPENGDLHVRLASVKSTRISDEAVEMLSPPAAIGEFASLAATPATSVAPTVAPLVAVAPVPKRTRSGARSSRLR